jgi:hypothetical protein
MSNGANGQVRPSISHTPAARKTAEGLALDQIWAGDGGAECAQQAAPVAPLLRTDHFCSAARRRHRLYESAPWQPFQRVDARADSRLFSRF